MDTTTKSSPTIFLGLGTHWPGYASAVSAHPSVSNETIDRTVIFGNIMKAKAELTLSMNLSMEGRMAAASPGPAFPGVLELLWSILRPKAGIRVVDLGAGLGGPSAWMQAQGAAVTAFELEPDCVAGGQALFPALDLRCGDAESVPLDCHDAVTAFGLLSLSADPTALLRSIARRLGAVSRDRHTWIASVDLVATGTSPVATSRNCFVPVEALANALPGWTTVLHHSIGDSDRSTLWHDVSNAVSSAVRLHLPAETLASLDADRANLDTLIADRIVEAAVTVFRFQ